MNMDNTYWFSNGKHQDTYSMLKKMLVPARGNCVTKQGQLLRSISQIYYDCYNNGWGNNIGDYTGYIRKYAKAHRLEVRVRKGVGGKDLEKAVDTILEHIMVTPLELISEGDKFRD